MKPGDLVRFTHNIGWPGKTATDVGILISSRVTKWDQRVRFYTFLTSSGMKEVILGVLGSGYEVLNQCNPPPP